MKVSTLFKLVMGASVLLFLGSRALRFNTNSTSVHYGKVSFEEQEVLLKEGGLSYRILPIDPATASHPGTKALVIDGLLDKLPGGLVSYLKSASFYEQPESGGFPGHVAQIPISFLEDFSSILNPVVKEVYQSDLVSPSNVGIPSAVDGFVSLLCGPQGKAWRPPHIDSSPEQRHGFAIVFYVNAGDAVDELKMQSYTNKHIKHQKRGR